MNNEQELLDFCRVKKIFDKGFGFLTSIHFEENVFFHFSKIKDEKVRESLQNIKRGVVYAFYTSKSVNSKRKVQKIWTDIEEIDKNLIPIFVQNVIEELNQGDTNIFETAHVIKLLRESEYLSKENFKNILELPRVLKTPTIIKPMLNDKELQKFENLDSLLNDAKSKKKSRSIFIEKIINSIYGVDNIS